ncbi:hypothetical protein CSUI_005811 [Cystoisospora suis]|uniref:Uncharacterized protein n=1 Tax=Cystoisospora suis TaxID=483139 RepID=A0A2C6KW82_9APIC|nr:hypothetical protein CSUI_005811 [Cystoisospora suis]
MIKYLPFLLGRIPRTSWDFRVLQPRCQFSKGDCLFVCFSCQEMTCF